MLFCKFICQLDDRTYDEIYNKHIQVRFDVVISIGSGNFSDSQDIFDSHKECQGSPFDQIDRNIADRRQRYDHSLGNDDFAVCLEFRKADRNAGFKLSLRDTQQSRAEYFCQKGDGIQGKDDNRIPERVDAVKDIEV